MSLNTNTELFLANTTNNSGTINLPVASSIPGRVIEFKDSNGTFNTNTLTLVCNGSDKFEDSSSTKILNTNRGNLQLVASGTKWYLLNGTQVNTFQVSSLTSIAISTFTTNTSSINVSSLGFIDNRNSTNTLYTSTSFLFYNNFIISGTRVGYSNIMNKFAFTPFYLASLALWIDAQNPNSYTKTGTTLTSIKDLGPNNIQITGTTGTTIGATLFNTSYPSFYSVASATLGITATNTFSLPQPISMFIVGLVAGSYIIGATNSAVYVQMNTTNYRPTTNTITGQNNNSQFPATLSSAFFGEQVFNSGITTAYANGVNLGTSGIGPNQGFFTGQTQGALITSISGNGTTVTVNFASTTTFVGITTIGIIFPSGTGSAYNGTSFTITSGFITGAITSLSYSSSVTLTPSTYSGAYVYYGTAWLNTPTVTIGNFGHICELIFYNGVVPTTQRQQIEGYLAWKWGLQANLPAGHPYINGPP
jgi:hypothetical protein